MRNILVVRTGHSMAGFYGAEVEHYKAYDDLPLEEFVKEWAAANDIDFCPGELEWSLGVCVDPERTSLHYNLDEFSVYFIEDSQS